VVDADTRCTPSKVLSLRIAVDFCHYFARTAQITPVQFRTTLMFERQQPATGTPGIAADAPVSGSTVAQGVDPLAAARAVARRQSRALSAGLEVARLPLADMPQLLV
jgi:hypothetical protein